MSDEEFWNSVTATEEEKFKGTYYLRERGLEEHFKVLHYLQSFKKSTNKKIAYREIATVLRYDKRIRRCLFKYIGVIEERLRAHFFDSFRGNQLLIIETKKYVVAMKKYGNDLYKTITNLTFGELVQLYTRQNQSFKESIFSNLEDLDLNLKALTDLRNQVYHNKFLLDNLELGKCKYNGYEHASLHANIKNLYRLSDYDTRESLIIEIDRCSNYRLSKYKNQVSWKLPIDSILTLDSDM